MLRPSTVSCLMLIAITFLLKPAVAVTTPDFTASFDLGSQLVSPADYDRYLEMVTDDDPLIRLAGVRFLGEIEQLEPEAVELLTGLLEDGDPRVQLAAAWALGSQPGPIDEVVAPLLDSPEASIRLAAATALAADDEDSREATLIACESLDPADEFLQLRIHIIECCGTGVAEAVPYLAAAIDEALATGDYYNRRLALQYIATLETVGAGSLDTALKLCGNEDYQVRAAAYGLITALLTEAGDEIYRIQAFQAAGDEIPADLYPPGSLAIRLLDEALPVLIERLGAEEFSYITVPSLIQAILLYGEAGRTVFHAALRGDNETAVYNTLLALDYYGFFSGEFDPVLFEIVESDNLTNSRQAAEVLISRGWRDPVIRSHLIELRHSVNGNAREAAVKALEAYAPLMPGAGQYILDALDDPDGVVRQEAVYALGAYAFDPGVVDGVIDHLLRTADATEVRGVMSWLYEQGGDGVPLLKIILKSEDPELRRRAAGILGDIGVEAGVAVVDLLALLDDDDRVVRLMAVESLGRIGVEPELVVPVLVDALNNDDYSMKVKAAEAIARYGEQAGSAVPELIRLLDSEDMGLVPAAMKALATIGPAAVDAVPKLEEMTGDPDFGAMAKLALEYIQAEDDAAEE